VAPKPSRRSATSIRPHLLGVGSGEALNEQRRPVRGRNGGARDRLIEAIDIIRACGRPPVSHRGRYYTVDAKLYDPPPRPIPLLAAAQRQEVYGWRPSRRRLITDPEPDEHKPEWEVCSRRGKDHPPCQYVEHSSPWAIALG